MKTKLLILWCGLLLGSLPAFALDASSLLDKILPPLPKTDTNQVSGVFYAAAVTGTVEYSADRIDNLKKGDTIPARGAIVKTDDNSSAALVFSNHTAIFIQKNTEIRVEKFDQEPFAPNNDLLIEPSNSQLIVFVELGQIVISTPQLLAGTRVVFETPHAACYIVNAQSGGEKAFLEVSTSQTHFAMINGAGRVKIREKDGTLASIGTNVPMGQQAFVRYAWSGNADDENKSHPVTIAVSNGDATQSAAAIANVAANAAQTAAPAERVPAGVSVAQNQYYVVNVRGTVQYTTKDGTFDLKQGDSRIARGTIFKTGADSRLSLALANETRLTVDEKTELKMDKFDQEPFAPNNNLDVEPSNSQTVVLIRAGHVGVDTPQLLSGTTLAFETPHGVIGILNNQSGGQQASILVTDKNTQVQMTTGQASIRPKGPDGSFVSIGYKLLTGQQAVVKPTLGADPTLANESFDEIKAAEGADDVAPGFFYVTKASGTLAYTADGKTIALNKGATFSGTGADLKTEAGSSATLVFSNRTTLTLAEKSELKVIRFKEGDTAGGGDPGIEETPSDSLFHLQAGRVDIDAPQLASTSSMAFETPHSLTTIPDGQDGGTTGSIAVDSAGTQIQMSSGHASVQQRGIDGAFVSTGTMVEQGDLALVKPLLAATGAGAAAKASITAVTVDPAPVAPPGAASVSVSGEALVLRALGTPKFRLPNQGSEDNLALDTRLPEGAIVETGPDSEVFLQPYPGAVADLKPNSRVSIEKLTITTAGGVLMKREIIFNLTAGNLVSVIDPAKHNVNRYGVRTPKGLAMAQGTSFTASVSDANISVAATADTVSFTTPDGLTYSINAGQVSITSAGGAVQSPIPLSQEVASDPTFAAVVQQAMSTVTNVVQNNLGGLPTNSAANLVAQVAAVAAAAIPADAGTFTTEAVTAVTTPGSATGTRPDAAAAAVVAAIVSAAPADVTQITNAGVLAAPGQAASVALGAATSDPSQSGAIVTAALQAVSTANPQASSQTFAQNAVSVASAVTAASPSSAASIASAAMTSITQNNPSASVGTLTQDATNLAANITAQSSAQGPNVAGALVGVINAADPGSLSTQDIATITGGAAAGQVAAARSGNGVYSVVGADTPTTISVSQSGHGNGGGSNNGGGGYAGGGGGNYTGGGGGGSNNGGGNRNGGGDRGGRQSTSVIITALTGGDTGGGNTGNSQATSVLVTQLNGGEMRGIDTALTAATNAQSTVTFNPGESSGGTNGPPTPVPTQPTSPPINFTVSQDSLTQ